HRLQAWIVFHQELHDYKSSTSRSQRRLASAPAIRTHRPRPSPPMIDRPHRNFQLRIYPLLPSLRLLVPFIPFWVSREGWIGLCILSFLAFVGTLMAIPAILIRLPPDYFQNDGNRKWFAHHHPVIRTIGLMIKNGLGVIFIIAGIAMLVLPGQGLLTILLG